MKNDVRSKGFRAWLLLVGICGVITLPSCASDRYSGKDQNVSQSSSSEGIKIKPGRKKVVTIYEFRSNVPRISSRDATDMFTTALMKTGAFAVVERQQIHKGFGHEKRLKTDKKATGKSNGSKLTGADYIFEGTVSEVNMKESEDETSLSLKGMKIDRSENMGSIGLDVRVIEANTGKVIEAVNVRKKIASSGTGVSGLGQMISSLTKTGSGLAPEVTIKRAKKDSMDKALRECIEESVYKIAERLSED